MQRTTRFWATRAGKLEEKEPKITVSSCNTDSKPALCVLVTADFSSFYTGGEIYLAHVVRGLRQSGSAVSKLPTYPPTLAGPVMTLVRNIVRFTTVARYWRRGSNPIVIATLDSPSTHVVYLALCRVLRACKIVVLVYHLESDLAVGTAHTRLRVYEWLMLRLAHRVVVISPFMVNRLNNLGISASVRLIPPGLEKAQSHASQCESHISRLLTVGKVTPRKGIDKLLEALIKLPQSVVLDVVGTIDSSEYERTLRHLIEVNGLGDRVNFHGYVTPEGLDDLRAAASLFVTASTLEGFGMALAEAMASGLPVVATDAGPTRQLVCEGAGLVVPQNDAVALVKAISSVLGDSKYRQWAIERADFIRKKYSWDGVCEAFTHLLHELAIE